MATTPRLVARVGLGFGLALGLGTARVEAAAPPISRDYQGPAEAASALDAAEVELAAASDDDEPADAPVDDADYPAFEDELDAEPESAPVVTPASPPVWMPRHRLIYRNFLAGRINPLGLVNDLTVGYRAQLVARDTPLFLDSFALVGAHAYLTPAFVRVGPTIEIQPAAVINLGVTYDIIGTFDTFNQIQSFASATDRWGPDDLARGADAGAPYRTWGQMVTLSALLQAKVKNVVVRTSTKAYWSDLRLRRGDPVYYDQSLDILLPDRGWALINETDVIYMFERLRLIARHSLTHSFYQRRHFDPGEPVSQPNGPTLRLGPAVAFTFFDRPGVRFNRPTVFLLSQWWLRHRWRTGEQQSAGIPYAAIGFAFDGDLVPHRKDVARKHRRRPR